METFIDLAGRTWNVSIDPDVILRLHRHLQIDFFKATAGKEWFKYATDLAGMADLLWVLCLPQAEARNIDKDAFGSALNGQTLLEAWVALACAVRVYCFQLFGVQVQATKGQGPLRGQCTLAPASGVQTLWYPWLN
jgi:hypothetical protein